jgi:hypothetical protein
MPGLEYIKLQNNKYEKKDNFNNGLTWRG